MTVDLDIAYARTPENLARLLTALTPSHLYFAGRRGRVAIPVRSETLRNGLNFTLTTAIGDIDLLGEITGGGGYSELLHYTITLKPFGIECFCLGLNRLIQVKRAAGRAKDWEAIAELEALEQEGESAQ